MISYKIMSINLCNQGYYILPDLFVLPKIQKYQMDYYIMHQQQLHLP